jgi:protein gp37
MSDNSAIEWTDATWNPIRARNLKTGKVGWHCEHATTGCEFCYAEGFNKRLGTGLPFKPGHRKGIEIFLCEETLLKPLRWNKPRMIFPGSMTDLFADFVRDEWLDKIFAQMMLTPHHTYQVLTKRAARMREYISNNIVRDCALRSNAAWPLPNVWLGVSTERQPEADERIPQLLRTPAAVRFISYEPALGQLDIARWLQIAWQCSSCRRLYAGKYQPRCPDCGQVGGWSGSHAFNPPTGQTGSGLNQVISGGESGPKARPSNPQWFRDIRDQCASPGVAYFHKQNGEWVSVSEVKGKGRHFSFPDGRTVRRVGKKKAGRLLDGIEHNGMPEMKRPAA